MESEPTRVMVAVNESSIKGYPHASISSKKAFEWTLKKIVKSNTSGFKLLLLHAQVQDEDGSKEVVLIMNWEPGFDDMDSIYASPDDFRNMRERNKANGLHLLEFFVNKCHEIGVRCEAWIRKGDPTEVICHEVRRVRPDFLVVGSRGLGPFQKVFVGTVSEFCVKHAECPVIIIKRSAEESPQDPADD
ncbi:hypothetical protein DY000_02018991 [Brassica cretica]|uniref:UspA domain-containing protein n=1 Tax=Brassica cretica TaxID=69181 RepID=A0ABQ7D7C2_BRACR|nr:hypothetical protein DY000_02018991 [Brassica cretica]